MQIDQTESCCGAGEIYGLNYMDKKHCGIDTLIQDIFVDDNRFAFYFFGDNLGLGNAERLVKHIKKHKLGTVVCTLARFNPNHPSPHKIKGYLYTPSLKGLRAYGKKHKLKLKPDDNCDLWGGY